MAIGPALNAYISSVKGRAVNRAYATNGLNQYTAAGSGGFTYDANGNLTGDGATTFAYDIENRLVSASGARNATLAYDPLGRLYQVTAGTGAITRFLSDGDDLIAEYDGAGTLLRRYVHWTGTDTPFLWYEGATLDSARTLNADKQGSIILVSDQLGIPSINRYDEYGIPAATNTGRFQYTGQAWLSELGLYHYKARLYSPTLGRFLQTDPIGYDDQFNLYEYVGDDPVNHTDPSGTQMWSANPFASEEIRDLRARINETMANGLWQAEQTGYFLIAEIGSLAFGPEGEAVTVAGVRALATASSRVAVRAERIERAARGALGGSRAGRPHTRAAVREAIRRNAEQHGGEVRCRICNGPTTPTTRRLPGSQVAPTERQGGHVIPRARGGDGATVADQRNIEIHCSRCNLRRGTSDD